jgi:hypothetical protein
VKTKRTPSLIGPVVVMIVAVTAVPLGIALLPAGAGLGGALLAALIIMAAAALFIVGYLWSLVVLFLRRPLKGDSRALATWFLDLVVSFALAGGAITSVMRMIGGGIVDVSEFGYAAIGLVIGFGGLIFQVILMLPGPGGLAGPPADAQQPGR